MPTPKSDFLTRGVVNIISSRQDLEKNLKTGEKLNIYLGIDPTLNHVHLGHAVPLRKLQIFAEMGHNVTFLIGDFTALIGDTSDQEGERPILTTRQIKQNFKTYKKQVSRIINLSSAKVVFNSRWLKKLGFKEIISLAQHFSLGDFISRDLIAKRLREGRRVRLDEVIYPLMQGYDSLYLSTDVQIGSADQTFNMQAGRKLLKELKNKESFILVTNYLPGTDGRKMSKSLGNAIWLDDSPQDMFGKVMAIKDELIPIYFELATQVPLSKVEEAKKSLKYGNNPRNIKLGLAWQIVKELYSEKTANEEKERFIQTFTKGKAPKNVPAWNIAGQRVNLAKILVEKGIAKSRSNVRRLVEQGGISINNQKVGGLEVTLPKGTLKIGKKTFIKIQ